MKKGLSLQLIICIMAILLCKQGMAQRALSVTTVDGARTYYDLSNIHKITFLTDSMQLYQTDGSIRKYARKDLAFMTHITYMIKAIQVQAGALSAALSEIEKKSITALKLKGTIDARDFKTLRDSMPLLATVDFSEAAISAYNGNLGTAGSAVVSYDANAIPRYAFRGCGGLNMVVVPSSVTVIGAYAFYYCNGLQSFVIHKSSPVDLSLSPNVFYGASTAQCTLSVPSGSDSVYKVASQWQAFTKVVEHKYRDVLGVNKPTTVGNKGTAYISVNGNGMQTVKKVRLLSGDSVLVADTVMNGLSFVNSRFNFDNTKAGLYDVEIQFADTVITLKKAFEIQNAVQGTLKIEIVGNSSVRSGTNNLYNITITNTGNVMIENPCVELAVNSDDSNFKVFFENYDKVDKAIFDSLGFDVREFYFTNTDDLLGQNRSCKLGMFFLSNLSAYESKTLQTRVKSTGNYSLAAWKSDYTIDEFAEDAVSVVYTDGHTHNYLKSFKSSTTNICDKIYVDCYNEFMSGVNKTIGDAAKEQLLDLIPIDGAKLIAQTGYNLADLYIKMNDVAQTGNVNEYIGVANDYTKGAVIDEIKGSFLTYAENALTSVISNNQVVKKIADGTIDNMMNSGKYLLRSEAKNFIRKQGLDAAAALAKKTGGYALLAGYMISDGAVEILSMLKAKQMCKPSLKDCNSPVNYSKDNNSVNNTFEKHNVTIVKSCDPNNKIGYQSPSGSRYFNADKNNFTYIINFENKATATAPAQAVYITDTLDLKSFDINSFRAGFILIGSKVVQAPYNVQSHTWSIDLRPTPNLITQVILNLDTLKGIAQWTFTSLDPVTDSLVTDPLAGFLPPNDSIGSGQGSVCFTINLKNKLVDGAEINNKATIVFDDNQPITTPTWSNTKDIIAPVSTMNEPIVKTDSIAMVKWQAVDNAGGSGIYAYNVFMKEGTGAYQQLISNSMVDSLAFTFKNDITYSFYVNSVDSADNKENKTNVPDVTFLKSATGAKFVSTHTNTEILYPNPASQSFTIKQEGENQVQIFNMQGILVYETTINGNEPISVAGWAKGLYIVKIKNPTNTLIQNLVVE